ncbi:hypothetical protein IMZ48_01185 [Candidatus Bathyarchaeota archaeon]|nr:hypothetical protein [Candidatus Bathyarchaeota archaeon]
MADIGSMRLAWMNGWGSDGAGCACMFAYEGRRTRPGSGVDEGGCHRSEM